MYFIALEGTTRHGLSEAVKFILRGALGHTFFPSPPELRMQCDKAMEWHHKEADRIRRQSDFQNFRKEEAAWKPATEDEKARSARLYAEFCKGYEKAKATDTFKLDPELVAQIPDNPKAMVHQRHGR